MAYTSIHTIRATVSAAIAYITNGDKTVNGVYVNSYACRADSAGASEDFRAVRQQGTGRTQILAYHLIQSFAPDEVTPEQAMQIGEELCDKFLQGNYQYVLAVHNDKEHIHCHIIFNNTNLYNGLSFTTEHNQGRKNERAWAKLREISDELCKEYGISVIEAKSKGVSHFERNMQKEGKSWKDKLRVKIAEVMLYSRDFKDFLEKCAECGIEYVYKPSNKVKLKFRLSGEGQQKFTRADTLGDDYTAERIAEQIAEIQNTQSIAEKKEDLWVSIRGMRNCEKIIADLESVGIKSFKEFSGFMWNCQHSDDHTEELSLLKKKITAIDKLLAMMKQRSQHSTTYKEYQKRSTFTQKGFHKKNANAIDSYEQADKFIKEHIRTYYVDGKAPKQSELQEISAELKAKYNAFILEHNVFLEKKSMASQYGRQVRTYLQKQHQQEYEKQYNERKRSHQKRKDTLE